MKGVGIKPRRQRRSTAAEHRQLANAALAASASHSGKLQGVRASHRSYSDRKCTIVLLLRSHPVGAEALRRREERKRILALLDRVSLSPAEQFISKYRTS